jgi:hypothetical protein
MISIIGHLTTSRFTPSHQPSTAAASQPRCPCAAPHAEVSQSPAVTTLQENWGLILYREGALLYNPATDGISEENSVVSTVAHEIGHQW